MPSQEARLSVIHSPFSLLFLPLPRVLGSICSHFVAQSAVHSDAPDAIRRIVGFITAAATAQQDNAIITHTYLTPPSFHHPIPLPLYLPGYFDPPVSAILPQLNALCAQALYLNVVNISRLLYWFPGLCCKVAVNFVQASRRLGGSGAFGRSVPAQLASYQFSLRRIYTYLKTKTKIPHRAPGGPLTTFC